MSSELHSDLYPAFSNRSGTVPPHYTAATWHSSPGSLLLRNLADFYRTPAHRGGMNELSPEPLTYIYLDPRIDTAASPESLPLVHYTRHSIHLLLNTNQHTKCPDFFASAVTTTTTSRRGWQSGQSTSSVPRRTTSCVSPSSAVALLVVFRRSLYLVLQSDARADDYSLLWAHSSQGGNSSTRR
jgi:hypothetical protein